MYVLNRLLCLRVTSVLHFVLPSRFANTARSSIQRSLASLARNSSASMRHGNIACITHAQTRIPARMARMMITSSTTPSSPTWLLRTATFSNSSGRTKRARASLTPPRNSSRIGLPINRNHIQHDNTLDLTPSYLQSIHPSIPSLSLSLFIIIETNFCSCWILSKSFLSLLLDFE